MATMTAKEIYEQLVKHLPPEERQQLVELVVNGELTASAPVEPEEHKRSIMELHGLGAETWKGIDAQEYINELRQEWDHRP